MVKLAIFDSKSFDKEFFKKYEDKYDITYYETLLTKKTVGLAKGYDAISIFVNDVVDKEVIDKLYEENVKIILLRCAGYNNVDIEYCYKKIHVARVPSYSPTSIAEFAFALLLSLSRKVVRGNNRTKEFNFSLDSLVGFDLAGKTIGVVGTGQIGSKVIDIAKGFGMNVIFYDIFKKDINGAKQVELDELYKESDIISLHSPLTADNYHFINKETIGKMKQGVVIINTSRGGLINTSDLIEGLKSKQVSGAGLDVYEEESDLFFSDLSSAIVEDDVIARLLSFPNVIVTSHQAFLTDNALTNIASETIKNLEQFLNNEYIDNELCYRCKKDMKDCYKKRKERCF